MIVIRATEGYGATVQLIRDAWLAGVGVEELFRTDDVSKSLVLTLMVKKVYEDCERRFSAVRNAPGMTMGD